MAKVRRETLEDVKQAFEEYKKVVDATGMTDKSKWTYTDYADRFVRWLDDNFEPGAKVRRRRRET